MRNAGFVVRYYVDIALVDLVGFDLVEAEVEARAEEFGFGFLLLFFDDDGGWCQGGDRSRHVFSGGCMFALLARTLVVVEEVGE